MVLGRAALLRLVLKVRGVNPLLYVSMMCHDEFQKYPHLKDEFPVTAERGVFKGLNHRHVRIFHVGVLAHEYD
jgi:hypothetical protein